MRVPKAILFFRRSAIAAFATAATVLTAVLFIFWQSAAVPGEHNIPKQLPAGSTSVSDTIDRSSTQLQFRNNSYYWKGVPFSGVIKTLYPGGSARCYMPVRLGQQHGTYTAFYPDGKLMERRSYADNLANGRHTGFWPNGKKRFDYTYVNDKREGYLFQWYENGKPYMFTHYINDREDGLQQAWRSNGKLFINYVAKNGHKYGLEETQLCYTLTNQQLKQR